MEIIAAVIGVIGVICAAFVSTGIFKNSDQKTYPAKENDVSIPYRIHRDELDKKEFEIRLLVAKVSVFEDKVHRQSDSRCLKTGGLVDLFHGVTETSHLNMQVAIKENGRMAVFHNKLWRYELRCVEFYLDSMKLYFTVVDKDSGNEEKRFLDIPIKSDLAIKTYEGFGIVLIIRMDEEMKNPAEGAYVPLAVYATSKVENDTFLTKNSPDNYVKALIKNYSDKSDHVQVSFYDAISSFLDPSCRAESAWSEISDEITSLMINRLDLEYPSIELKNPSKYYLVLVSFYDSAVMLAMDVVKNAEPIPAFFIVTKNEIILLNGSSPPIHNANWSSPLRLSKKNVVDYLKYYCFFMKIKDEVIYIIDGKFELPKYFTGPRKAFKKKVKNIDFSVICQDIDETGSYAITCKTLSSNGIVECCWKISQYGMIDLTHEKKIISRSDFKVAPNYFSGV